MLNRVILQSGYSRWKIDHFINHHLKKSKRILDGVNESFH